MAACSPRRCSAPPRRSSATPRPPARTISAHFLDAPADRRGGDLDRGPAPRPPGQLRRGPDAPGRQARLHGDDRLLGPPRRAAPAAAAPPELPPAPGRTLDPAAIAALPAGVRAAGDRADGGPGDLLRRRRGPHRRVDGDPRTTPGHSTPPGSARSATSGGRPSSRPPNGPLAVPTLQLTVLLRRTDAACPRARCTPGSRRAR